MITCPTQGDIVSFVYKGPIIIKGIVDSNGFDHGTYHQTDSCNIGTIRPHAVLPEFVCINITEIGLFEYIRPTGQRTWTKMPL